MNKYCSTCLNHIASDPCDGCDGTEENHIYYEPDFVRKDTKPRYIDAEKLKRQMGVLPMDWNTRDEMWTRESDIACYIDTCPEADVVEVVYCKDCRFECGDACLHALGLAAIKSPKCYCAYGERRREEKTDDKK